MTQPAPSALLLPRLLGVLGLRAETFREIAGDTTAGMQAGLVVVLSGVIDAAVYASVHGEPAVESFHVLYAVLAALIGWMVWSGVLFVVGARIFEYSATFDTVVRVVGFAHASALVYGIGALPALGEWTGMLFLVSLLWFLSMLAVGVASIFRIPPRRAALVLVTAMAAHEVLRQALTLLGLA